MGESFEACLKRELIEEFGTVVEDKIKIGPKIFENFRSDRNDHFYVVWFDGDDVIVQAKDEILNHRWCSPEEVKLLICFFGFEYEICKKALSVVR